MGHIITPYSPDATDTPFIDLNPLQRKAVEARLCLCLAQSFLTDETRKGKDFRKRIQTKAEERRRGEILIRWFRVMRQDEGYSLQQALDLLPRALRTELDGGQYQPPPKNRLWTPEGVIS